MTQKRGLGRGLGALIPGADQGPPRTAARTAGEQPAEQAGAPAPAAAEVEAPALDSGEAETLRTRNHPRTRPEPGESGASSRPVDMFFSGEPVEGADRAGTARSSHGRDVAGAMARAAAERRAAARKPSTRRGRAASAESPEEATELSAAVSEAQEERPARASTKGTTRRKSPDRPDAAETADAPAPQEKKAAAPAEPEESAAPTKPARRRRTATAAQGVESEAAGGTASTAGAGEENGAAVEVEPVVPTPVRETARPASTISEQTAHEDAEEPAAPSAFESTAEGTTESTPEVPPAAEMPGESGPGDLVPVPGAEFAEIPIHEIRENPRNPRTLFDDDALDELAYSVREVGVLQPVVVRPIPATDAGESFELVMGERRWRASRRAGLATIPAIIRETSDDDLLRDALLENLHRSQLNPLEEAAAYQQLLDDFGCTQDELADRIGRSRPQISNTLRLMKLPPLVQRRLASGVLSAGHARALLGLDDPALMEELAQRIVAEGLSVRAVERLVTRGVQPETARPAPRRTTYDPRVVDYTSRLATRLEAPVRIDVGKRKGRITLEFTNLQDLERLMERLGVDETNAASGDSAASSEPAEG